MVLGESIPVIGGLPTNAALTPPLPPSPWQAAHFCTYMGAPCAGVPLPGGRPVPSGIALMSQAPTSFSVIGWPRLGPCWASAVPVASASAAARRTDLRVDMFHL